MGLKGCNPPASIYVSLVKQDESTCNWSTGFQLKVASSLGPYSAHTPSLFVEHVETLRKELLTASNVNKMKPLIYECI